MSRVTRHFIIIILFLVPSCGFEPVYGSRSSRAAMDLSFVEIAPIPAREGQLLMIALEDRFNPDSAHAPAMYRLSCTLQIVNSPIAINPDGTASRYRTLIASPFALSRISDGTVLYSDTLWQSVSYHVSDADYSTYVASQDALGRGLGQMSEDYMRRIAAFFKRYQAEGRRL